MRFPVRSDGAAKQRFGGLYVLAIEQEAQSGAPLVEQLGQLGYAYVGKVLWSEPQELPLPVVHRLKRKLIDRKSTRLNSSHANISYAVFCLKKKKTNIHYSTGSR